MKLFLQKILRFSIIGFFPFLIIFYINCLWIKNHPFPELKKLNRALKSDNAVLMFGSSVNKWCAKSDTDKRSISEMLDSIFIKQQVTGISHEAYTSDIYLEFVRYVIKINKNPRIIIPINLRYFSPSWDLRPNWQFVKEKCELNGYPEWVKVKPRKEQEKLKFENHPVFHNGKKVGTVKEIFESYEKEDANTALANGFILHYLQPLIHQHRKLKALKEIVKIAEEQELEVLMYITPIDFSRAEDLKIEGFREQVLENIKIINNELASSAVEILDLSFSMESQYFGYDKIPNEHLNMFGKQLLAEKLNVQLKKEVRH